MLPPPQRHVVQRLLVSIGRVRFLPFVAEVQGEASSVYPESGLVGRSGVVWLQGEAFSFTPSPSGGAALPGGGV